MNPKVSATDSALALIGLLTRRHGQLMFHQSGGCCDGSSPMCFVAGEFKVSDTADVLLGSIGGAPFYMGVAQYEKWRNTRLTIDVVSGRGSGFSLEAPEGFRFITRSDLCVGSELDSTAVM